MGNWKPPQSIRVTAQAVIVHEDSVLVYEGVDRLKKENFYRPVGGGVEFLEPARDAVVREFREEAGIEIHEPALLGVLENIYTYEGHSGHEIVQVFQCKFKDAKNYDRQEFSLIERGEDHGRAVWKEIRLLVQPEIRFFPNGMKEIIKRFL